MLSSLLVNIDHGILPGASSDMKEYMGINNFGFGALGTIVYAGLTVGAITGMHVFSNYKYIKQILVGSIGALSIILLAFTLTDIFWLNLILRLIAGFLEIFIIIYAPVWADTFGSEETKSIWLSISLLASPVGIFTGFILVGNLGWKLSFQV